MIFRDLVPSMRSARLRRQQHQRVKQEIKQPSNSVPESSQPPEKMVEEDIPVQDQYDKMHQFFIEEDHTAVKNDVELLDKVRRRYNALLEQISKNENVLKSFNFSEEEKDLLNKRVELWLEYFVSSATFNREKNEKGEEVNLFEYMEYFFETQKFV